MGLALSRDSEPLPARVPHVAPGWLADVPYVKPARYTPVFAGLVSRARACGLAPPTARQVVASLAESRTAPTTLLGVEFAAGNPDTVIALLRRLMSARLVNCRLSSPVLGAST
jgi:hypothetical protein